jgi:hypothetical protein
VRAPTIDVHGIQEHQPGPALTSSFRFLGRRVHSAGLSIRRIRELILGLIATHRVTSQNRSAIHRTGRISAISRLVRHDKSTRPLAGSFRW